MAASPFRKIVVFAAGAVACFAGGVAFAPAISGPWWKGKPQGGVAVSEAAAAPMPETRYRFPEKVNYNRRSRLNADELAKQLLSVPELLLDDAAHPDAAKRIVSETRGRGDSTLAIPDAITHREDLAGFPLRRGVECRLDKKSSETLQELAKLLRDKINAHEATEAQRRAARHDYENDEPQSGASALYKELLGPFGRMPGKWQEAAAVPTLVQVLTGEGEEYRLLLVEALGQIQDYAPTVTLAKSAIFDPSEHVREAAIGHLAYRPRQGYRDVLLEGLRYPWPPVADHAAEALGALKDMGAIPALVELLEKPDPADAYMEKNEPHGFVVRELVRMNHLRNCLVCHPPSFDRRDLVRGLVPTPGVPINPTREYDGGFGGTFVRADITFLRQDFSMTLPVVEPGSWPRDQRCDCLVRARRATAEEKAAASAKQRRIYEETRKASTTEAAELLAKTWSYPQRESVLFALRELTGKDPGASADSWRLVVAKAAPQTKGEDSP